MNLKEFLQLAGQQGKVVVMGEDGNVKGVFLSYDEFQKLSGTGAAASGAQVQQPKPREDLSEKVNREILQAQLEEVISSTNGGTAAPMRIPTPMDLADEFEPVERIDSLISKRAHDLFKSVPAEAGILDFPYGDFTTPHVTQTSDEEIKPNFDDI